MTWAVCPGVRYAATSRYESRHKKVVESMAVKQRFRRHVVWILTLLIMLSFSIATSAEDVTQKRSNVSESTETERYQVVVPTDVDGMFDFILDPQGLINETNAAMYDGESFEADSTVFFKRTDGRVETDYSSKSDFFTIINRSTVPINITLELKMKEEEYPWLTINEIKKKLKKDGIICIIAPNGLGEHRYPVDCWRFYGDGMRALARWCGLEVIETSIGGVPDLYASKKFDSTWNDACLVACKSVDTKNKYKDKQMFPVERRYDIYGDLKLQSEFLGKWKCDEERINQLLIEGVVKKNCSFVYIIGEEFLAEALDKLLKRQNIKCRCINEDYISENGNSIDNKQILYIITTIDVCRVVARRIQNRMQHATVLYLDYLVQEEIINQYLKVCKNQFKECRNIYIYGAGVNAKEIEDVLNKEGIPFSGFVVSDDRIGDKLLKKDVYKISEISNESGIIVSPYDNQDIYKILKEKEFKCVFDGLLLIKEAFLHMPDRDGL